MASARKLFATAWADLILFGVIAIAFAVSISVAYVPESTVPGSRIAVIDGDTIDIGGVRYRLVGFDTPETYYAQCDAELLLGKKATAELERLIASSKQVKIADTGRVDRYSRKLAHLSLDGQNAGQLLIAKGLAVSYSGRGPRRNWCRDMESR